MRDSVHFTAGIALCQAASHVATHRTLIRMITGQADPRGLPADVDQ